MCGINGFSWKDSLLIEKMNRSLEHRGPDDQGAYLDDQVSLGHRRLSIIDLSPAGRQPKSNEDGSIWIVFNGEIYNFQELREELEASGHRFSSSTDTEVIIHAYEQWGPQCLDRFNGMWAFAIYDKNKDLLFLSRDRFGVKPLYYYRHQNGLVFSSEIKGILQHSIERTPNDRAIYDYLALGFMDHIEETFFRGICRIMPGECMLYDLGKRSERKWMWYDAAKRAEGVLEVSVDEAAQKVRDLFEDSVRYRLISDVPVGSCLSGGIDSSAIVYAMRRLNADGEIRTFSMVYPGSAIDESSYADEVVQDNGTDSHKITPTAEDLQKDLEDLIWTQEEPFRTPSIYGQYKVMQLAHENGMKVLLDGQGSDELFAGYMIYYKYYLFESLINLQLKEAWNTAAAITDKLNDMILFPVAVVLSRLGLSDLLLQKLYLNKLKFLANYQDVTLSNPLSDRGFSLNRALRSDMVKYSIPQLLRYEDKNSMRWSIESRVPFLDYRLVELAMSLPSSCKIRSGTTKHVLRRAMSELVSERILNRRDKIGFATPDDSWMKASRFAPFMEGLVDSEEFGKRRYWDRKEVKSLLREHLDGRKNHEDVLWRVLNLELWLRMFIDSPHSPKEVSPQG